MAPVIIQSWHLFYCFMYCGIKRDYLLIIPCSLQDRWKKANSVLSTSCHYVLKLQSPFWLLSQSDRSMGIICWWDMDLQDKGWCKVHTDPACMTGYSTSRSLTNLTYAFFFQHGPNGQERELVESSKTMQSVSPSGDLQWKFSQNSLETISEVGKAVLAPDIMWPGWSYLLPRSIPCSFLCFFLVYARTIYCLWSMAGNEAKGVLFGIHMPVETTQAEIAFGESTDLWLESWLTWRRIGAGSHGEAHKPSSWITLVCHGPAHGWPVGSVSL